MIKQDILNVLIYLFEYYADEEQGIFTEDSMMHQELEEVGFQQQHISKAMEWLDDLATLKNDPMSLETAAKSSFRIFNNLECERISVDARGFILSLEYIESINVNTREMILERVMALDSRVIDIQQMQWVTLIVLLNTTDMDLNAPWVQEMFFMDNTIVH